MKTTRMANAITWITSPIWSTLLVLAFLVTSAITYLIPSKDD